MKSQLGLCPWFGLWPDKHWGIARTEGGTAKFQASRRGGASPHIRRLSSTSIKNLAVIAPEVIFVLDGKM